MFAPVRTHILLLHQYYSSFRLSSFSVNNETHTGPHSEQQSWPILSWSGFLHRCGKSCCQICTEERSNETTRDSIKDRRKLNHPHLCQMLLGSISERRLKASTSALLNALIELCGCVHAEYTVCCRICEYVIFSVNKGFSKCDISGVRAVVERNTYVY